MSQRPARRRGRGRRALLILLLLTVFGAAFLWWSNRSLQVDRFTYASPRLPAGFDGCVVVQLSDLHGALFGENNQDLIDAVRAENPDYIFLTGDLLDRYRRTPQSYAVDLGRAMAAIAPTYFVTGNHEWALPDVPGLKAQLEEAGVTVLSNEFTTLERNGDAIVLAGIDDPNGYADQKTPEELAAEVEAACPDAFWLLLAHRNNLFAERYSRLGADLVISSACPSPTASSAWSGPSFPPTPPGSTRWRAMTSLSPGGWGTPGPASGCSTGRRWRC